MEDHLTLSDMTRRIDAGIDTLVAVKACRAIIREAAARISNIGAGAHVLGVEEITFVDAMETVMGDYLRAKQDRSATRAYLGMSSGMDEIQNRAADLSGEQAP